MPRQKQKKAQTLFSKENCCHWICNAWKEKGGEGVLYTVKAENKPNTMKYWKEISGDKRISYFPQTLPPIFYINKTFVPPVLFPTSSVQSCMEYLLKRTTCFSRFNYLQAGEAVDVRVRLRTRVSASTQCSCNRSTTGGGWGGLHNPCAIPTKLRWPRETPMLNVYVHVQKNKHRVCWDQTLRFHNFRLFKFCFVWFCFS